MSDLTLSPKRFSSTRWSQVLLAARAPDADQSRSALDDLVRRYWYPLYAFCRRNGQREHDALDLTQGFFTHLLDGNGLASVSPEKGRFRSFLLAAFRNYMANQRRAGSTERRGGATVIHSLAGADFKVRYDLEPADTRTPELLFEQAWVHEMLRRVRTQLAEQYQHAGKTELFALLEPHLTYNPSATPRSAIGAQLKLSPAAVNMSIHRLRRAFGDLLRHEIASTVDDPADVEGELHHLLEILDGAR